MAVLSALVGAWARPNRSGTCLSLCVRERARIVVGTGMLCAGPFPWGRTLSGSQVGAATGHVTAFVNGKRFAGDPRSIKLTPHAVIQLDVGTIVPPQPFTFPAGL